MLLSAHKGAISNKDSVKPSDVSTGTASGYCSWQIKKKRTISEQKMSKNFELFFTRM